jgi:UDP-glucose 4-epimerase
VGNVSSRRDYVFVDDVANALASLARYCQLGQSITVNVGTGRSYSGHEILRTLADLSGSGADSAPIIDPDRVRSVDRPMLLASNDLARKALGWEPRTPLPAGLRAAWDRPMGMGVTL